MNFKKTLSLLLVAVMIFSALAVNVSAAEEVTYTTTGRYIVTPEQTLDPEAFAFNTLIDNSKIAVLEGGSNEFTYEIVSLKASYIDFDVIKHEGDYVADPEEFFAVFEKKEADVEHAATYNKENPDATQLVVNVVYIDVELKITFVDSRIFGTLDYTFEMEGFKAPISTGIGFADDLASAAKLPIDVAITGNIAEFPAIASTAILSRPEKTEYYDSEKFDATGLSLSVTTSIGKVGTYTFSEETAYMFSCNPSNKENLTTYDSEVITYLNGVEVIKTPIVVDHKWSDGYVNITTDKISENKPGYHAIVCEGCGETHDAQPHVYNDESWVDNGDQTFLKNGTQSNTCDECGATLIRDGFANAGYREAFKDYHFILVIFDYIHLLVSIITTAVN